MGLNFSYLSAYFITLDLGDIPENFLYCFALSPLHINPAEIGITHFGFVAFTYFLKFSNNKIKSLRLNLSHLTINKLIKNIKFIKKNSKIPICIDTEGAQIRTKVKKEKYYRLGQNLKISKLNGNFCLYPENVYSQLKINDILNIGFSNLNLRIINLKNKILCKVIKNGKLENNKGIHLQNRKIKLNYLTKKDFKAIESGLI